MIFLSLTFFNLFVYKIPVSTFRTIEEIKFVKSVELVPRKGGGVEDIHDAVETVASSANLLTSPENPMGRPGIDPVMALYLASQRSDLIVMPHITPRDKNSLYVYSQVLTALKFGINHFFMIGGDPIDQSLGSKEVRETDVMGLISSISSSEGYVKKQNGYSSSIRIGSALNPYREHEQEIAARKRAAGSDFFISQILFESQWLKKDWLRQRNFKVIAGFFPLRKKSQLEFVRKMHVPISSEIENKIQNSDNVVETSRKLILEAIEDLKGYIDGVHIMPIGHNEIAKDILESI